MLVAIVVLAARAARAEDDAACQEAYVAGQRHYKLDHDLVTARGELLTCAKTCPDELRASCGRWLEDLAREIPSIVVRARDAQGRDVAATVDLDHRAIEGYVDGQPIELNAGPHELTIHRAGRPDVAEAIVVTAGQKLRVIDVWTEPRAMPAFVVRRPVPTATWVLLATSGVALASFGVFATWTTIEFSKTSACSPTCAPSAKDDGFDAKAAVADVSLGVAATAFLAAGVFYLTRPTIRVEQRVSAAPWLVARGAGFGLSATF